MVGLARVGDGVQPGASSHLDPGLDPSRDTGGRERARVTTQVGLHTHTHTYTNTLTHTHPYTYPGSSAWDANASVASSMTGRVSALYCACGKQSQVRGLRRTQAAPVQPILQDPMLGFNLI